MEENDFYYRIMDTNLFMQYGEGSGDHLNSNVWI